MMHLSDLWRPKLDVIFQLVQRSFYALVLILLTGCVITPESENVLDKKLIFTPGQLREDLRFLNKSLTEIHPDPFSRLDITTYQSIYQQLQKSMIWPLRRQDFYRQMAPLISKFADTHTRLLFPQQEYQQSIQQYGAFPLVLLYSEEGMIVVADQQPKLVIPVGAKLLAINDIAIESILENFKNYIPAETDSGQRRMIQMEFPRLLWSLYDTRTGYEIDYLWQGKVYSKKVSAIKQPEPLAQQVNSHYGSFSINKQTALIWLNDFNERYDVFEGFLQRQFKQMAEQKVKTLILDLRYNKGGVTDNLALLLHYLTNKKINWATRGSIKLSESFRKQHSQLLSQTKSEKYGNYLDWLPVEYLNLLQWEILLASDGEWLTSDIKPVFKNREYGFKEKLLVLSNGYCFSACASLVATLQRNNLATIIGESPGSQIHVQYGYPIEVALPNTGLKLVVPAMKFELADGEKEQQKIIIPDHQIERNKIDVILGQDTVLEYAVNLSETD